MSEHNKANVRRLFDELWNKGNLAVADELIAPTYITTMRRRPMWGAGPKVRRRE